MQQHPSRVRARPVDATKRLPIFRDVSNVTFDEEYGAGDELTQVCREGMRSVGWERGGNRGKGGRSAGKGGRETV